jgi:hypothetical protein
VAGNGTGVILMGRLLGRSIFFVGDFHMSNKCRFCPGYMDPSHMVKYGTRHYAHHGCYLAAGKSLGKLPRTQVGKFPLWVLKDHGLVAEAIHLLDQPVVNVRRRKIVQESGGLSRPGAAGP